MTDRFRPTLIAHALLACLLLVTGFGTATAAAEKRVQFNIAPQELASALNEFARQSDQELMFSSELAAAKRTAGVIGEFAPYDALKALLQGTGLRYRITRKNTILIERETNESAWRVEETQTFYGASLALAQEGNERPPSAPVVSNSAATNAAADGAAKSLEEILEEVLVTGSWIRGVPPAGAPLTSYTREDIDLTGVATLEQFARHMTQNYASVDAMSVRSPSSGGFSQSGDNVSAGAAFNLHGFGPTATLTLLNGHRVAPSGFGGSFVDVSMIPLGAIERVDVLTDGTSALYGADAIAGVVNIILRENFEGAETKLRYGATSDGGGDQTTGSQMLGKAWQSGGAMVVYEYDGRQEVYAAERDFIPTLPGPDMISPAHSRHSVLMTANQRLGDTTKLSLDAYHSHRNSRSETSNGGVFAINEVGSEALGGTLGLLQELPGAWHLDLSATASKVEQPAAGMVPSQSSIQYSPTETEVTTGAVRADGPLFSIGSRKVRAALGGDVRSEKLQSDSQRVVAGVAGPNTRREFSRDVWSVVGEIFVPIIEPTASVPGLHRLEMSVAGRHDQYDDVGSSTNPKVGFVWSPVSGLNLRGTYGTSFHAPLLAQLVDSPVFIGFRLPNPTAASGFTNTIFIDGSGRSGMKPETARSITAGFDFIPESLPKLQIAATYFDLEYEDRVSRPPLVGSLFALWSQQGALAPFIDTSPDPAEVQAIFTGPFPFLNFSGLTPQTVEALFDNRPNNIAGTGMTGVDLSIAYGWATDVGRFGVYFSGSHVLKNDFQSAVTVPAISLNDKLGSPVDLRLNAGLNWAHAGFGSSLTVSHWDDYENPLLTPSAEIASWTTIDLQVRYGVPEDDASSILGGFQAALTIQNLANARPPRIMLPPGAFTHGYDPANASALGRTVSLQLTKSW